jgi:hypothetical protein
VAGVELGQHGGNKHLQRLIRVHFNGVTFRLVKFVEVWGLLV